MGIYSRTSQEVTDTMAQQHDEDPITAKSSSSRSIRKNGIDIEQLPPNLKVAVDELNLDTDGDGRLDTNEIIMAVEHLAAKTKANTSLKKIVYVLCGFSVVLVAALFGASIAAARLAKDTSIDPVTGIMYAKDSRTMMKTEQAKFHRAMNFALLSNKELDQLMEISMTNGDVKFEVKGYHALVILRSMKSCSWSMVARSRLIPKASPMPPVMPGGYCPLRAVILLLRKTS